MTSNIEHFIWYGQSEWQGWQAAPPLTVAQRHDCLMFGRAPRPRAVNAGAAGIERYDPVGDGRFHPLVSVCQELESGRVVTAQRGGVAGVRGARFAAGPLTVDFAEATLREVRADGERLEEVAVDGAGEPPVDLTRVFAPGMRVIFHAGGGWVAARNHRVQQVTATRLVLNGPPPEDLSEPFEIHVINGSIDLLGEESGVGALTHLRGLRLAAGVPGGRPLLTNACIGGMSVAALSKEARSGLYNRVTDAAARVFAAAAAQGLRSAVPAVVFGQGGTDCQQHTEEAAYAARLAKLAADLAGDIVAATGQAAAPLFLTFQVSGANISGNDSCAVPMAQLELALRPPLPGFAMIGPFYFVPDQRIPFHGIHWTGNGARWAGQMTAKVLHRILDRGEAWLPLHPTHLSRRGRTVMITFHVPAPPLQFRPAYCGTVPTLFADRGFEVSDGQGQVALAAVEIVADRALRITCARPLTGEVTVHYGGVKHRGAGNLCDSDAAVASESYVYTRFGGQAPEEEIPELLGKPYPLWNWCVLFRMTAAADEDAARYQGSVRPA